MKAFVPHFVTQAIVNGHSQKKLQCCAVKFVQVETGLPFPPVDCPVNLLRKWASLQLTKAEVQNILTSHPNKGEKQYEFHDLDTASRPDWWTASVSC